MKRIKLVDRILPTYTKGEEIFNMTSHIVGAAFGVIALVLCVIFSGIHHNGYAVISSTIYGTTMILLYTMSSIYHGLRPNGKSKKSIPNIRSLFNIFIDSRFIYSVLLGKF